MGTRPVQVAAALDHSCAVLPSGQIMCWGANAFGAIGDGTETSRLRPTAVQGINDAVHVSIALDHTCAVRRTGQVVCWGWNGGGVLGDGTVQSRSTPRPLPGVVDAVEVALGSHHACLRHVSGRVSCWGGNQSGQLGDGTRRDSVGVVAALGLDDATALAAGPDWSCATRASGRIACWGAGGWLDFTPAPFGSDRNEVPAPSSKPVDLDADVRQVIRNCTLDADGRLLCKHGGPRVDPSDSTVERVLEDVIDLSHGFLNLGCAKRGNGSALCWSDRTDTFVVAGLSDVSAIAAGFEHACGVRGGGTVVCWGGNTSGQLGDGTRDFRREPVEVLSIDTTE